MEFTIPVLRAMNQPLAQDIVAAYERISGYIHKTPVVTSQSLNEMYEASLFFKCENLQKIGAFKARGAMNAVLSLSEEELEKGVATHSSGNHGQALAWAAKAKGITASIVVPSTAPGVKKAAMYGYGAEITECEPTLEARESNLAKIVASSGAHVVHPYNDYRIIAGQATCAYEVFQEYKELDYILAPVGGGGLLSGTALSAYYFSPQTRVIGCEPEGADDAYRSFIKGEIIPSVKPNTIADGLLTSLGDKTFAIIKKHVEDILTVDDELTREAMHLMMQRLKLVVEPSAAVPLACLIKNRERFVGKKVAIIISGGNVDLEKI